MSNRSLYPQGVEVHQRDLEHTESQRAAADNQLLTDATTRGVVSGLAVTVGGTATRVSIASGSAYAPNGEYMELATGQTNVALASDTLGVINYVLLMYDEEQSLPESHETDGTTQNTRASVAPRLVILTETQYNALQADDEVLTSNDRNRAAIIAKVTANGPAVVLTTGSIQGPTVFEDALSVTQPTSINGVTIISVLTGTPSGTGELNFLVGPTRLTWAAPGDTAGSATTIIGSGSYTLTSLNGLTALVVVAVSGLPAAATGPDDITVTAIYTQEVPRHSAEDFEHRSMIGSGAPTLSNPHGMTIDDLSAGVQGTLQEHQDVMHANGIARFSAANTLDVSVDLNGASADSLRVGAFSAGDYAYVNGNKINVLDPANDLSLSGSDGKLEFDDAADTEVSTWAVYINQDGFLVKEKRAELVVVSGDLRDKLQIINVSDGITTGTCTITWNNPGGGSTIDAGGRSKPAPSANTVLRLFLANDVDYIDVYAKGASTPVATQTATCTFTAGLDLEENFTLACAYYTGFATGHIGYGFGLDNSPNTILDRRTYGNLGAAEMNDSARYTEPAEAIKSIHDDGIVLSHTDYAKAAPSVLSVTADLRTRRESFNEDFNWPVGTTAGASFNMGGGRAYVGGKMFEVPATVALTMTAGGVNKVYIDSTGTVQTSPSSWEIVVASQEGKPITMLWEVTLSGGGAETDRSDLRNIINSRHDKELGVVGLNEYRQAAIGTTSDLVSGTALTVAHVGTNGKAISAVGTGNATVISAQSLGTGNGIGGTGGLTGGDGIVGAGFAAGTRGGVFTGGATTGQAVHATGGGSGAGVRAIGGPTNGSVGVIASSSATNGDGIQADGSGDGTGIIATGGTTDGSYAGEFYGAATNATASKHQGTGTGSGIQIIGGATDASYAAVITSAATNGNGFTSTATGSGIAGTLVSNTGNGLHIVTTGSGNGIGISSTSGQAVLSTSGGITIPAANVYKYATTRTGYYHVPASECRLAGANAMPGSVNDRAVATNLSYDGPTEGNAPFLATIQRHDLYSVILATPTAAQTRFWGVARLPVGATVTGVSIKAGYWGGAATVTPILSAYFVNSDGASTGYTTTAVVALAPVTAINGAAAALVNGGGSWRAGVISGTPVVPADGWLHLQLNVDLSGGGYYFEFFEFRVSYTYTDINVTA